jgi:hypothetical protein
MGLASIPTAPALGARVPQHATATDRADAQASPPRPQTPKPPFPYRERAAVYDNPVDKTRIAGTLTVPAGTGPHPAVLLLPGSGPLDRDETMLPGHKPFWVIADYLTRRGIAVLRSDDRGVGDSAGDYSAATGEDLADDALAGIAWLRRQPEIDPSRVGLIGHSQGGLLATLAAGRSKNVAFVVLLAAPALPDREAGQQRVADQLRRTGQKEDAIAAAVEAHRLLFERTRSGADDASLRVPLRDLMRATYPLGPLEESALNALVEQQLNRLRWRIVQYFMEYDPRPALRALSVPVLAILGSLDQAVSSRETLGEMRKIWLEAGNSAATVLELYGVNHLFQTVATGHPSEMLKSDETFSPRALEIVTAWLRARTGLDR